MSQMISSRSNHLEIHARGEGAHGRAGNLLLTVPGMLLRSLRRAWTTHSDERLLQELSDYQLRDIGIRRGQIARVVRNGRDW
jgi:uncharacterized protein YjiS (DUF1127 family)